MNHVQPFGPCANCGGQFEECDTADCFCTPCRCGKYVDSLWKKPAAQPVITDYLDQAKALIPSGCQTYSKSSTRFPKGAPQSASRGSGAYIFDGGGARWLDCVSGLGSVILGHHDTDVDAAISKQLAKGISFPLPTELEYELARRIVDYIPSAEMVRFCKNGADSCAAAVRIARAVTGRERVVSIGYHGYHDYTIARQNPRGVPKASADTLTVIPYGDLEALYEAAEIGREPVACVIMEPIVAQHPVTPPEDYLFQMRMFCTLHGAILIFDEVVTFGRMLQGSAQKHYGVTPDLTALGKCLGNGMPLNAVVGRADLMRTLDEGVFFSTTHGGEALSLAAGIATVDKLIRDDVPATLDAMGRRLIKAWRDMAYDLEATGQVELLGYPSRLVWKWTDPDDAARFGEALVAERVLSQGYLNLTLAFGEAELAKLERAWARGVRAVLNPELRRAA